MPIDFASSYSRRLVLLELLVSVQCVQPAHIVSSCTKTTATQLHQTRSFFTTRAAFWANASAQSAGCFSSGVFELASSNTRAHRAKEEILSAFVLYVLCVPVCALIMPQIKRSPSVVHNQAKFRCDSVSQLKLNEERI